MLEKTSKVWGFVETSSSNNSTKPDKNVTIVTIDKKKEDKNLTTPIVKPEPSTPSNDKNTTTVLDQSLSDGDPDLSEADISSMMSEVIEQKKQEKFQKMIEKGSAIAA